MQKAENAGEVNWDDEGLVQFFTDDGQLKVRRAKAKKRGKMQMIFPRPFLMLIGGSKRTLGFFGTLR